MHFCCLAEALPPGSLMLHPNENEELEELRQDMTCDETVSVSYGRHQRPGLDQGRIKFPLRVRCPCPFRLRRLAENGCPGLGRCLRPAAFSSEILAHALVSCPCVRIVLWVLVLGFCMMLLRCLRSFISIFFGSWHEGLAQGLLHFLVRGLDLEILVKSSQRSS